ncbi:MAG: hypothetical protein PHX30_01935 [Candidatus Pacebacteria bacterium]|jgi:hypothetical protein|nr:hypothetical protein [Candidatus Paceibacterota bacterium]
MFQTVGINSDINEAYASVDILLSIPDTLNVEMSKTSATEIEKMKKFQPIFQISAR